MSALPDVRRAARDRAWRWQARLHERLVPRLSAGMPAGPDRQLPVEVHGTGGAGYAVVPDDLGPSSVVWSVGIGAEISFDRSIIDRHGVTVHGFDPTAETQAFLAGLDDLPDRFVFHPWALTDRDGPVAFRELRPSSTPLYLPGTTLPVGPGHRAAGEVEGLTLASAMRRLGHDRIDVLKLDVEGAEYQVLGGLDDVPALPRQLVLEFHPHLANLAHHRLMVGRTGWRRTREAIDDLRRRGYELVHVSGRGTELSFRLRD